jgi:hypothetical protein
LDSPHVESGSAGDEMTKWEYTVIEGRDLLEAELNGFGRAGWELVTVRSQSGGYNVAFYFKRLISN